MRARPLALLALAVLPLGLLVPTGGTASGAAAMPARVLLTGGAAEVHRTYTATATATTSSLKAFSWPSGITPHYRWYRGPQYGGQVPASADPADYGFTAITGATAKRYTLTDADHLHTVVVHVSGVDSQGRVQGSKNSAVTNFVLADMAPPTLSGSGHVGHTIVATLGPWAQDWSTTLQWRRDGVPIPGAISTSYTPVAQDAGSELSLLAIGEYVYPNGVHPIDRYASRIRVHFATSTRLTGRSPGAGRLNVHPALSVSGVSCSSVKANVTLYDGTRRLKKVGLVDCGRTVRLTGLSSRTHRIRAVFAGTGKYAPSRTQRYLTVG